MDSKLIPIIERLIAVASTDNEHERRFFQKDGVERIMLEYTQEEKVYKVTDLKTSEFFRYDNVDLAAMEIFEMLYLQ